MLRVGGLAGLERDPVFTNFLERRARILGHLDTTRVQVDAWIDAHLTAPASITELAQLEGLLAERRNLLDELLKLDDSLLDHLVVLLGNGRKDGG
jgi:hypothetical protein